MQKVTVEPTANRMLNSNARRELFPFCGKSCPPTKPITKGIVDNEHGMSEVNTPETIAITGASQSLSATASANDFKNSFILSSLSDLFSVLLRQSAQAAASADYFHSVVCDRLISLNCLRLLAVKFLYPLVLRQKAFTHTDILRRYLNQLIVTNELHALFKA